MADQGGGVMSSLGNLFTGGRRGNNGPAQSVNQNMQSAPAGNTAGNFGATNGQPVPGNQGSINNQQTGSIDPSTGMPTATDSVVSNTPADPFEGFSDIWAPVATDPNAINPSNIVNFDQKQLQTAVSKLNFVGNIDPNTMSQIASGDPAQMQQGLYNVINRTAQSVMIQVSQSMQNVINSALQKNNQLLNSDISNQIRQHTASNGLTAQYALLSNPAVKPMADVMIQQLTAKNPGMHPDAIKDMAVKYFQSVGSIFNPQGQQSADQSQSQNPAMAGGNVDWTNWIG